MLRIGTECVNERIVSGIYTPVNIRRRFHVMNTYDACHHMQNIPVTGFAA